MERVATPEAKETISTRAEMLIGAIDKGVEIRGSDVIVSKDIQEGYRQLCEMHAMTELEDDPAYLAWQLRKAGKICRAIENPVRSLYLTRAVADLARMDFGVAVGEPVDSCILPPADFPVERRLPVEYYDTLALLVASTHQVSYNTATQHSSDIAATQEAAVAVGNSNYGKIVQRALLRRLEEVGASEEELFKAYVAVPNKVRLPERYIQGNEAERAQRAVARLGEPGDYTEDGHERLGNYIRATHDVLGAAVVLRRELPRITADECVAALYENAPILGALAKRFTTANPLDHKLATHDVALFLERVNASAYVLEWTDETRYPRLAVPMGMPNADEFPRHIFSNDPVIRMRQEEHIARQRMNASRCPIRHLLQLPEGETKRQIEEFDVDIKSFYGVDPGIFTQSGKLNPAALTIARTIQAGVWAGTPEHTLWTQGLEEWGVSPAKSE